MHGVDARSPGRGARIAVARNTAVLICAAVVLSIGFGCGSVRGTGKPLLQEGQVRSATTGSGPTPAKADTQLDAKDASNR